jgi:hypothetical protein
MRPSPEDIARLEPVRMARRPSQCHLGEHGVCWVKDPYGATLSSAQGKCQGCGGQCGGDENQPSRAEIEACGGRIS